MSSFLTPSSSRLSRFFVCAWLLIAVKCVFVAWAVPHWNVPVNAGWVIWPTVLFGLLATGLWLGRERNGG